MELVSLIHLLKEYECQDGVGTEPEVVRSEAFPQGEETFFLDNFGQNVSRSFVLRFACNQW